MPTGLYLELYFIFFVLTNLGPTGPRWAHVGPMNFAIWVGLQLEWVEGSDMSSAKKKPE